MFSSWGYLFLAALFEIIWAVAMKYYHIGLEDYRMLALLLSILSAILSFILLTIAMKDIPASIAYTVWTGTGIVGVSLLGFLLFKEPVHATKVLLICIVLSGIIGLKLIE